MKKKNWLIKFNNGSTAAYWNINLLDAVKRAVADWSPVKFPMSWVEITDEVLADMTSLENIDNLDNYWTE